MFPYQVFTVVNGNPIHPDNVRHDVARLVHEAGIPLIRVHELRHIHVTLAMLAGANLVGALLLSMPVGIVTRR